MFGPRETNDGQFAIEREPWGMVGTHEFLHALLWIRVRSHGRQLEFSVLIRSQGPMFSNMVDVSYVSIALPQPIVLM